MLSNTLTTTAVNLSLLPQRYDRFPVLSEFSEKVMSSTWRKSSIFVTFLSFISALWILHNRFDGEGKFWVFADSQRNYKDLISAQYFQFFVFFLERGCKLQHLITAQIKSLVIFTLFFSSFRFSGWTNTTRPSGRWWVQSWTDRG